MSTTPQFFRKFSLAIIFAIILGIASATNAFADASLTAVANTNIESATNPATGSGAFTSLTGPTLAESAAGQIKSGTLKLTAPTGFEFDTSTAVTILLTSTASDSTKNINHAASGTHFATTETSSTISFTITSQSTSAKNILKWENIKIRPIAVSPLASGQITLTNTGLITGVALPANAGMIAEVDTIAPVISGLTNDSAVAKSKTWVWSSNDADAMYRYSVDANPLGTPSGAYGSATTATQASGDGTYYLHVQTKDKSGNESAVTTVSALLDNTAPTVTLDTTAAVPVTEAFTVDVVFSEAVDGFDDSDISVTNGSAGGVSGSGTTYSFVVTPASPGTVTISIGSAAAIDAAGNDSTTSNDLNISYVAFAPNLEITSGPDDNALISNQTPTFGFTSSNEGVTFVCSVDAPNPTNVCDDTYTSDPQSDGSHTFYVKVSASENFAIAHRVFTVDTAAPVVVEVAPIATPSANPTPSYIFATSEAGTIIYGGSCSSATTNASAGDNSITFSTLADGAYSDCSIIVTDAAGNSSTSLSITPFTIDTTPPIITLNGDSTMTVALGDVFADPGATATDAIDGPVLIKTSGSVDTSSDGTFAIDYDAADAAGNHAVEIIRTVNVVRRVPQDAPGTIDEVTDDLSDGTSSGGGSSSGGTRFIAPPDETVLTPEETELIASTPPEIITPQILGAAIDITKHVTSTVEAATAPHTALPDAIDPNSLVAIATAPATNYWWIWLILAILLLLYGYYRYHTKRGK